MNRELITEILVGYEEHLKEIIRQHCLEPGETVKSIGFSVHFPSKELRVKEPHEFLEDTLEDPSPVYYPALKSYGISGSYQTGFTVTEPEFIHSIGGEKFQLIGLHQEDV